MKENIFKLNSPLNIICKPKDGTKIVINMPVKVISYSKDKIELEILNKD